MNVHPLHHSVSFYPLLFRLHLQVANRKVRNLQISVDRLVGKVSINLLPYDTKFWREKTLGKWLTAIIGG